jgi:hypothetical protein
VTAQRYPFGVSDRATLDVAEREAVALEVELQLRSRTQTALARLIGKTQQAISAAKDRWAGKEVGLAIARLAGFDAVEGLVHKHGTASMRFPVGGDVGSWPDKAARYPNLVTAIDYLQQRNRVGHRALETARSLALHSPIDLEERTWINLIEDLDRRMKASPDGLPGEPMTDAEAPPPRSRRAAPTGRA